MKELLNQIKKTEWYKQAGNCRFYSISIPCMGAADLLNANIAIWSIKNKKQMEWVSPLNDFVNTSKTALNNQKEDPKFIDKHMKKCKEKSLELEKFYSKYIKKDISKLNIKQIADALHELEKLNYDYWQYSYLCDAFDPKGDEMLIHETSTFGLKLNQYVIDAFMRTNWKNYMQEERLAMLKLAFDVKTKKIFMDDAKKSLELHADKYFYVGNSWESSTILKVEDFANRLDETLSLSIDEIKEQLDDLDKDWDEKHKQLQEKYSIPNNMINVFYFFSQLFKLRDQRKKHTLLTNHFYDSFFQRVADLFSIDFNDLGVILAEEITDSIIKNDLKRMIEARKDIVLISYSNKKIKLYEGAEAFGIYDEVHKTFVNDSGVIKGNTAFSGKVKGIVRVIMGEAHFSKFNPGEILVAPMTRPEFLPLMKKAKAIITDEGGITCHAAIVSRELGIPCIIGTKIATKVLKDNDLVEVDAEKGIVRKI